MDASKELQALYDREVNFSISCSWDSGIRFRLGDERNGYKAEITVDRFAEGVDWLVCQAALLT